MSGNTQSVAEKLPKTALDLEGVVAGTYIAELWLINDENPHQHHTFDEMVEYPHPGGTVFGLSYEEHTHYRRRTWMERWDTIPRYVDEGTVAGMALVSAPSWVTAAGDGGILPYIEMWKAANYPNVRFPTVPVPKGSDKTDLDFDMYIDDAPRLGRRIAELYRKSQDSGGANKSRPKRAVMPRWPYTPMELHTAAPGHILRVAPTPQETFAVAKEMLRTEQLSSRILAPVKSFR